MRRDARQQRGHSFNDAGGFGDAVEEQRAPNDVEDGEGQKERAHLRPEKQLRSRAKLQGGDEHCCDPAGDAGARAFPAQANHQHQNQQDGYCR